MKKKTSHKKDPSKNPYYRVSDKTLDIIGVAHALLLMTMPLWVPCTIIAAIVAIIKIWG